MIFVDTGGWFAAVVPNDPNHDKAAKWLAENKEPLFTTDYVVDETLTLLRRRGENLRALTIGENFFNENLAEVYRLSIKDLQETWKVFRRFKDKEWSFTDCSSKVVMENFSITKAFAFDKHFRQFGNVIIVP